MPDKSISNIYVKKGKILEYAVDETLSDILFSLRVMGVNCYHIYSRIRGGKQRISIDFLVMIRLNDVAHFLHIEAKNYNSRMLNKEEFSKKILDKFLSLEHIGQINHDKHYKLLVGNVVLSKASQRLLEIHKIDYLETGELPYDANDLRIQAYVISLREKLEMWIKQVCQPTVMTSNYL